jgi:flagellar hook-associated protein 1
MGLDGALGIASGGLANINGQLALISQNVANASTPEYAAELSTQTSLTADGEPLGVHSGPATRLVDVGLQASVFTENGAVSALQTKQTALQAIDSVQGTPGQDDDLGSLLANVGDQFSTLLNDPSNQAQQSQVVFTAGALARQINSLSTTYTTQRQAAQDALVTDVGTLNGTLSTIGNLSRQIIAAKAIDVSTADLENERDAAVQTLSQLVSVKTLTQANGDMLVMTSAGLMLPTRDASTQLTTSDATISAGSWYPGGGIPAITLGGADVTNQLRSGSVGAEIDLRDNTLPTFQGELDEFAQNLASRFNAQGLALFTDASGAVPASGGIPVQNGYVGFASTIQVNPAVQADPSLVRDGTAGPPTGLTGYTGLIENVLNYALGDQQSPGVPQPPSNTNGLGPSGTLNAPYTAPPTLAGIAATLVAAQAQESASTTSQLSTEQTVQSTLAGKLSAESGVSMDTEMSNMITLQNAYGANARVISVVQALWTQLMNAVT